MSAKHRTGQERRLTILLLQRPLYRPGAARARHGDIEAVLVLRSENCVRPDGSRHIDSDPLLPFQLIKTP